MIPSVRYLIDQANNVIDHPGHRINIPPEEINKLSDHRRREQVQLARGKRDYRVAKAKAKSNQIRDQENSVDLDRAFGLPHGQGSFDIWEKILGYIEDPDDIIRIALTCQLFWDLLKDNYKAVRLSEVTLLIHNNDTGYVRRNLLKLRQVCQSSKATVDKLFKEDTLDSCWFPESNSDWSKQNIPKPQWYVETDSNPKLDRILTSLEVNNIPNGSFPLRIIHYRESDDMDDLDLMTLRTKFERLLGHVGSSISSFNFVSIDFLLETYNRLRSWIVLMPTLMELEVDALGEVWDPRSHPRVLALQQQQLQAFPPCPNLKKFINHAFASPFIAEIFRAIPGISGVIYNYYGDIKMDPWGEGEGTAVLRALDSTQVERFNFFAHDCIPPFQFVEFRFGWPLKYLSLTVENGYDTSERGIPSKILFEFVNSFSMTLEELAVTWKIHDTGGYLDVPKVSKLLWKFWPEFSTFDFIVPMENIQLLDFDMETCPDINKASIIEKNLPGLFPRLRKIRARLYSCFRWKLVWKS